MRFVRSSDAQSFIDALEEILHHAKTIGALSSNSETRVQSGTEAHQRAAVGSDAMHPAVNDTQLQSPASNGAQYAFVDETSTANGFSSTDRNLPSSFTAFLADCSTESQEAIGHPLLFCCLVFLQKHMPRPSFHVMFRKIKKFISDMGGDLGIANPVILQQLLCWCQEIRRYTRHVWIEVQMYEP